MSDGNKSSFLFYLPSNELLEFFADWPPRVALAILSGKGAERFYLLPQESAERDLQRLGDASPLPVFPPVAGMPSISMTYAQENQLLQKLASRDDLLNQALKISERLAAKEQAAQADEGPAETSVEEPQDAPPASGAAPSSKNSDLLAGLFTGFAPAGRPQAYGISLFRKRRALRVRVGSALLPEVQDEPLVGIVDASGRRLALLPAEQAKEMALDGVAFVLNREASDERGGEFEIPRDASGIPEQLIRSLSRRGREQELALVAALPTAVVADLGPVVAPQPRRRTTGSRLMIAATAASWLLTIAAMGGLYWQASAEAAQETASTEPDFRSEEYVQGLLERLFPNEERAGS